jgi:hypothetical protein
VIALGTAVVCGLWTPYDQLPSYLQTIGMLFPQYWAFVMTKPVFSVFAKTEMATPQDVTSKDINTTTHIYAFKAL